MKLEQVLEPEFTTPVANGLRDCHHRVATARNGTFFCRNLRVHTKHHLVDSNTCSVCGLQDLPCLSSREVPADPLAATVASQSSRWEFITLERMATDVRRLAEILPADISAVAGIPRSGMIPASLLSALLHLPLFELDKDSGLRRLGCGTRLTDDRIIERILVIDDSIHGGIAMTAARAAVAQLNGKKAIFAALYPTPEMLHLVDFYARPVPSPHLFEWNLFNCHQTQFCALDMDGVICEDWSGGNEEGSEYQAFLKTAKPKWLPRRAAVHSIVTARLEKHRTTTLDWLHRHGVRFCELVMCPASSSMDRRHSFNIAEFKAKKYMESNCMLFVESDSGQAETIAYLSNKPVLCPTTTVVYC